MTGSARRPQAGARGAPCRERRPLKRCTTLLGAGFGLLDLRPLARGLGPDRRRAGDHPAHQQGGGLDGDGERRLHRLARRVPSRPTPPIPAASSCSPRSPISASPSPAPPASPSATSSRRRCTARRRRWLIARFDAEILSDQRIALDLMSDRGADGKDARLPDSIDQRLDTCTDHLYGGLIGLVMGFIGAVASIWFVSVALISRSQPVEVLDRAGAAANRTLEPAPRPGDRRPDRPRAGRLRHRDPRRRPRRRSTSRSPPSSPGGSAASSSAAPSSGSRATAPGAASSPRC